VPVDRSTRTDPGGASLRRAQRRAARRPSRRPAARRVVPSSAKRRSGRRHSRVTAIAPSSQDRGRRKKGILVPRDGIEPPTRGFSRLGNPRKSRRFGPFHGPTAAPVPQKPKIRPVQPRHPAVEDRGHPARGRSKPQPTMPIPMAIPRKRRGKTAWAQLLEDVDADG
jgi:hypothetical protein